MQKGDSSKRSSGNYIVHPHKNGPLEWRHWSQLMPTSPRRWTSKNIILRFNYKYIMATFLERLLNEINIQTSWWTRPHLNHRVPSLSLPFTIISKLLLMVAELREEPQCGSSLNSWRSRPRLPNQNEWVPQRTKLLTRMEHLQRTVKFWRICRKLMQQMMFLQSGKLPSWTANVLRICSLFSTRKHYKKRLKTCTILWILMT